MFFRTFQYDINLKLEGIAANAFDNLIYLESLYLNNHVLSSLPEMLFDKLEKLTGLFLDGNLFTTLPITIFDKLTTLIYLKLANNPWSCSNCSEKQFFTSQITVYQNSILYYDFPKAFCNGTTTEITEYCAATLSTTPTTQQISIRSLGNQASTYICQRNLAVGSSFACIINNDNTVSCWGKSNYFGSVPYSQTPSVIFDLSNVTSISAGYYHVCSINTDDEIHCWGINNIGQMGSYSFCGSDFSMNAVPQQIGQDFDAGVVGIYTSDQTTCALKSDQKLFCWGYNSFYGMFSNDTSKSFYCDPKNVDLPIGITVSNVFIGGFDSILCVVDTQGNGYCRGEDYGINWVKLDIPNIVSMAIPTHKIYILNLDGRLFKANLKYNVDPTFTLFQTNLLFHSISKGEDFVCGITFSYEVYCWGDSNDDYRLGRSLMTNSSTPMKVNGLNNTISISSQYKSTCSINADDKVFCWGSYYSTPQSIIYSKTEIQQTSLSSKECSFNLPCDVLPCNSGTCENLVTGMDPYYNNSFKCKCDDGYKGSLCNEPITGCFPGLCQNGAICTDIGNTYSCSCPKGYSGKNCETDTDECASNPCQNGGTCSGGLGAVKDFFSCQCVDGFNGTMCENNACGGPCGYGKRCTARGTLYHSCQSVSYAINHTVILTIYETMIMQSWGGLTSEPYEFYVTEHYNITWTDLSSGPYCSNLALCDIEKDREDCDEAADFWDMKDISTDGKTRTVQVTPDFAEQANFGSNFEINCFLDQRYTGTGIQIHVNVDTTTVTTSTKTTSTSSTSTTKTTTTTTTKGSTTSTSKHSTTTAPSTTTSSLCLCQNGGICLDNICNCINGFTGPLCEGKKLSLFPNPNLF